MAPGVAQRASSPNLEPGPRGDRRRDHPSVDHERDQDEIRYAQKRSGRNVRERVGQAGRVDLAAMNPRILYLSSINEPPFKLKILSPVRAGCFLFMPTARFDHGEAKGDILVSY